MTDMANNNWSVRAHLLRATIMKKPSLLHNNVTGKYRSAILCELRWNPWDIVLAVMFLGTFGFDILKRTNNLIKSTKYTESEPVFWTNKLGRALKCLRRQIKHIRTVLGTKFNTKTSPGKHVCTFTRFYFVEDHKIVLLEESLRAQAFVGEFFTNIWSFNCLNRRELHHTKLFLQLSKLSSNQRKAPKISLLVRNVLRW